MWSRANRGQGRTPISDMHLEIKAEELARAPHSINILFDASYIILMLMIVFLQSYFDLFMIVPSLLFLFSTNAQFTL